MALMHHPAIHRINVATNVVHLDDFIRAHRTDADIGMLAALATAPRRPTALFRIPIVARRRRHTLLSTGAGRRAGRTWRLDHHHTRRRTSRRYKPFTRPIQNSTGRLTTAETA